MNISSDIRQGLSIAARVIGATMALAIVISFIGIPHIVLPIGKDGLQLLAKPPGHHCIFCGMTRGFCSLSRGDLSAAVGFNHYVPIVYAVFWIGGLLTVFSTIKHRGNQ